MMDAFDILADELEKDIEASLSEAFAQVVNAIDIDALAAAIQSDDDAAIAAALNLDEGLQIHLDHVLANGLFYVLLGGIVIAMKRFANRHGSVVHPDREVARLTREIRRNVVEPLARRAYESALITIQILRAAGLDASTIAQETARALSLTPDQAKSVAYFHRALEEAINSPHATHHSGGANIPRLTAKEITRRHAGHLNAAQRSILTKTLAGDLTPESITQLTARHSRALSDFRRSAIARQEAVRIVNAGEYLAFKQGKANRSIPKDVRRFWQTREDERVRHSHSQVPGMNPDGVDVGEAFQTPFGPALYPPLEVNCRCRVVVRKPEIEA